MNKDDSATVHISNFRCLMTEVYKSLNKLNPEFMWDYKENEKIKSLEGSISEQDNKIERL